MWYMFLIRTAYSTCYWTSGPRTTFPALVVESDSEDQQTNTSLNLQSTWRNRLVQRTLQIVVNAEVQQTGTYARVRDQLLAQVEVALATSAIAGVKSITPTGFRADLSYAGDKPIAVGRQRFDVVYTTTQGAPATAT